jgi:GT2 family glycosyltransferase
MTNRFQEIFRGLARRGLGYIRAQTALRAQLFRCANSLGLDKPLLAVYKRIQAAATDGPPNLPELVVKSYQAWSAHFDSPSKSIMDRLTAGADSKMPVLVIARFEKNSEKYAPVLAKKLVDSIGQNWTAVFLFGPDCNVFEAQGKLLEATDRDPRICLDASAVTQQADVVVLIQGGALPRPHGLRIFADALRNSPGALLAYSDEDHLDDGGVPTTPWFKPKFSAILTAQGVLLGRMLAFWVDGNMSEQVMQKLLCDSTDIDAFVRKFALDNGERRVLHIPHVLFHDAFALRLPIVTDWSLPDTLPKTTIVIPTRDCWNLLGPCLESLWSSDWPSDLLDVLVVDNGSTDPETLAMLGRLEFERRIRVIHDARPFNWSSLNNLAARESDGELLIFLNNDTKADDPAWLKKLAAHALRPGVGAVGCKLLYPDRTVQHGGVVAGIQGIAGHAHLFLQSDEGGYCNLANTTHEVSAVTGACLAVTRKNFELAGGFNEEFRIAFNDFVFCLTLHSLGLRNVYVADPLLIHYESKSRGADDTPEKLALQHQEARRAVAIHSALIRDDPFYSPNLSLWKPYELAFAPRRRAAWDDRSSRSLKVMMLSGTHAVRDPVAIALSLQADALVKRGYEVFVAGPQGKDDFSYPGCKRVELYDPLTAATLAADLSVDLLMAYTQPFFSTAKWTGAYPPIISYDFGEPPPDFYPDAMRGGALRAEKDHAMGLATAVYAISNAIAAESRAPVSGVIPLGNAHLGKALIVSPNRNWSFDRSSFVIS